MVSSITSNTAAKLAQQSLNKASDQVSRSIGKISSGNRVFTSDEDASSLAIGTGLRVEIAALRSAQLNTSTGAALLQVADGALSNVVDILVRMKTLVSQAQSGQLSDTERAFVNREYSQMLEEINRLGASANFDGADLLSGGGTGVTVNTIGTNVGTANGFVGFAFNQSVNTGDVFEVSYFAPTNVMTITNATQSISQTMFVQSPQNGQITEYNFGQLGVTITLNSDFDDATTFAHTGANEEFDVTGGAPTAPKVVEFQIGTSSAATDRVSFELPVINTTDLGIAGTDISTQAGANATLPLLDQALETIFVARADLGGNMKRLEFAASSIGLVIENSSLAQSTLLDLDVAEEVTKLTAQELIMQTSLEMLSKANIKPQMFLRLLDN